MRAGRLCGWGLVVGALLHWGALGLAAGQAAGQAAESTLEFHLVRPGLEVPEYRFVLVEHGGLDGMVGVYTAENAAVPNRYGVTVPGTNETVQRLTARSGMVDKMFAQARSIQEFDQCSSRRKGMADTGAKTLSLKLVNQVSAVCHYNYSENTVVQELTREFQAMAATLDLGRKMERDERFDRLALDADMTDLVGQVKSGQAAGVVWIRGTLEALVNDPAVLERVRTQAAKLLEQSAGER